MQPPYALTLALILLHFASPSAAAGGPEPPVKSPAAEATNPAKPNKSARENRKRARSKDSRAKRRQRAKAKDRSAAKRPLSPSDYARWESIDLGNRKFSNDGKWLVYSISRVDEQRTLHLHRVKGTKTPEETTFKQGERPMFSNDSKWLAVTIGKTPAEIKKSKTAESKPPPSAGSTVHLRRLDDGKTTEFENVQSLSFSEDSAFVAFEVMGKPAKPGPAKPPSSGKKSGPSKALLVRTLANGNDTTFGNVVKFGWSDQGALLAMVIDSPSISNSLQLYNPATGVLRTLESSDQEYGTLQWRKDSYDLGVLREMPHEEKEDISHVLLAWRGLDQDKPEHFKVDHAKLKAFPKEMYIAPGLEWSKDGEILFCNLKKWEKKPKELPGTAKDTGKKRKKKNRRSEKKNRETKPPEKKEAESGEPNDEKERAGDTKKKEGEPTTPPSKTLRESLETPSNVEVWHSKDVEIMPRQKKQASSKKNPNRKAAWWLQRGKVVQLATDLTENVTILGTGRQALGQDRTPHERTAMFGPHLQDLYLINTANGKRERVLEGVKFTLSPSPDGRYFLFARDGQVWSHHVKSGQERDLTGKLETHFTNQEDDTLAVEKRPYGPGVWLKDSSAVLLYDRFDIWLIAPDGSRTVKLTDGAKNEIRHRISQASFHEDDDGHLDPAEPLYVALYGDRTKKSGYGRLSFQPEVSTLKTLLWDDRMMLSLNRAKEADVFSLTMERYNLPRDLYVAGPELAEPRQVTTINAFQKDFQWGHTELIDYQNKHGVKLQGSLTYPAGYQKGKAYPMIVYIYEKRSQELHRYITPTEKHPYNAAVFSAEGYFVFQPDIVYRPQEPGISAVECVVPAVEKVLETGMVDPARIGLMGHSWGAYQTSFIVTQTDLFAAGVAGAPLTDLLSMSVSVYWNSGGTNAWIFAQSQGRMNQPFWRDLDTYVRNSPIHGLDTLHTPLLITFGDKDGAVDWDQGVEMYNAARWAGKEDMVMLVYPGENHGLRKDENRVDYHYRVKEWFAHYLKGDEPGKWITEGKSFLEREKELEALKEKKDKAKKSESPPNPEKNGKVENDAKTDSPPKKKARKPGRKPKPRPRDSE